LIDSTMTDKYSTFLEQFQNAIENRRKRHNRCI